MAVGNDLGPGAPAPSKEERTWALVVLLSPFAGYVVPFVGGIIMSLIIYLVKRDESNFVAFHALQSLYYNIAVLVVCVLCIPLLFVCVGFVLLPVIAIGSLVYAVLIAIKAYNGEWAEYWLVGKWARHSSKG